MMDPYNDMITLPHHTSQKYPRMSMLDRAAQFSPFAALTGYEDAIEETGRLTDCQVELGEHDTAVLDRKYRQLSEMVSSQPNITITFFVPDERKAGGSYISISGTLKKIDPYSQSVILTDGTTVALRDITAIESDSITEEFGL